MNKIEAKDGYVIVGTVASPFALLPVDATKMARHLILAALQCDISPDERRSVIKVASDILQTLLRETRSDRQERYRASKRSEQPKDGRLRDRAITAIETVCPFTGEPGHLLTQGDGTNYCITCAEMSRE